MQCVKVHKVWESQTKFQKINHFGFHRLEFPLQFEIGKGQYVFDHFITKTIQKRGWHSSLSKSGRFFYKFCNLLKIHELYSKILNENTWAVYGWGLQYYQNTDNSLSVFGQVFGNSSMVWFHSFLARPPVSWTDFTCKEI